LQKKKTIHSLRFQILHEFFVDFIKFLVIDCGTFYLTNGIEKPPEEPKPGIA
jgi:hypothetical protein